jgi:hypothetical protein
MKVQQIKQGVSLENLEDWGSAGLPGTTPIKVSGVQHVIKGSKAIDTGIFRVPSGDVSALGEAGGSHAFPGGTRSLYGGRRRHDSLHQRRHAVF